MYSRIGALTVRSLPPLSQCRKKGARSLQVTSSLPKCLDSHSNVHFSRADHPCCASVKTTGWLLVKRSIIWYSDNPLHLSTSRAPSTTTSFASVGSSILGEEGAELAPGRLKAARGSQSSEPRAYCALANRSAAGCARRNAAPRQVTNPPQPCSEHCLLASVASSCKETLPASCPGKASMLTSPIHPSSMASVGSGSDSKAVPRRSGRH
mmetsp:Transcript_4961/g.16031  ORF Transcript_4961/g.16031 Transcript_4961/m.16031 type:complete len:209 (-) Transcript_4961:54-680(-)